ncbi:hypothetical protein V6N12_058913 [Hibiscus sabdariffa]|uniref:Endonuclease/exonuclease/phosphatase domain-containing protein n=1 Tax=Hibiscus sabdariffa TaxID=183260 RepID=A0ABR2ETJ3_9ROSI
MNISGGSFTWSNKRVDGDCVQEKLDRCFFNSEWSSRFPYAQGLALPAIQSDHNPIIIRLLDEGNKRKPSFKFETKWLEDDECDEVIKRAWTRGNNERYLPTFRQCISNTRKNLKEWNKVKFGNPKKQLDSIARQITELQSKTLTNETKVELQSLEEKMDKLLVMEERKFQLIDVMKPLN